MEQTSGAANQWSKPVERNERRENRRERRDDKGKRRSENREVCGIVSEIVRGAVSAGAGGGRGVIIRAVTLIASVTCPVTANASVIGTAIENLNVKDATQNTEHVRAFILLMMIPTGYLLKDAVGVGIAVGASEY